MSDTIAPLTVTYETDLVTPADLTAAEAEQYAIDDASGYWYAWGRLDQGHDPVVVYPTYSPTNPCTTTTATHFGRLWAKLQREYRDANKVSGYYPGLPSAWEHYVASGGRDLRGPHGG